MTSEAIKVNPNLNGLKLSRARFLRLIAFHQNFFQQMLPDESGMISILNILFIDLELLISTFEVITSFTQKPKCNPDLVSLNYHLNTLLKLQSGIAKLFCEIIFTALFHIVQISQVYGFTKVLRVSKRLALAL